MARDPLQSSWSRLTRSQLWRSLGCITRFLSWTYPEEKGGLPPTRFLRMLFPSWVWTILVNSLGTGFGEVAEVGSSRASAGSFSPRNPTVLSAAARPCVGRAQESSVCRTEEAAAEEPGALTCGRRLGWSGGICGFFCGSMGGKGHQGAR